ncbi:GNAT family N-acetyltransferase [Streptomyces sp. NPDC057621]|uniref:GNAT family N-acetyltransferase n=1 Tax=Streptomyces liliiviolaceus TaxID=2823109 RepID=A0A940Y9K5_9ACTN|nr:GNAT family protein [Streptomyces liliiviolaceus]MBQ0855105.1 GNAT family N-acetyltransferase [Streptomyces liliiviolaceus]
MTSFWTGERVRLRGVEPDDWTALMRFEADEERLGDLVQAPRSAEGHRARAKELALAGPDGDRFVLVVEAVDTGQPVGVVGSHHADARAGWFEYGISLGAEHRRRGYATEAATLLLRYMFAERRFHKCQARVFAHNEASLSLQRRLGLVEEGRLRDQVYFAGRHHDVVMMGVLADEFARLHPAGPTVT